MFRNKAGLASVLGLPIILGLILCASLILGATSQASTPSKRLPDGGIAKVDAGDIRQAWYVDPTTRYGHGVLGDAVEAGGLMIRLADGTTRTFTLPREHVFEDITPRIADLNGDGTNEVITITSDRAKGGAITIYGMRDGQLVKLAQNDWIGRTNRWLNPAGIADFDGDGALEIAIITTPHIGGILSFLSWQGDKLVKGRQQRGVSNHAIGSRALGLSAVADIDGDGLPDLVVPNQPRNALIAFSYRGGAIKEIGSVALGSTITGDFKLRQGEIAVPTSQGTRTVSLSAF